jgi:hypothetical protein
MRGWIVGGFSFMVLILVMGTMLSTIMSGTDQHILLLVVLRSRIAPNARCILVYALLMVVVSFSITTVSHALVVVLLATVLVAVLGTMVLAGAVAICAQLCLSQTIT